MTLQTERTGRRTRPGPRARQGTGLLVFLAVVTVAYTFAGAGCGTAAGHVAAHPRAAEGRMADGVPLAAHLHPMCVAAPTPCPCPHCSAMPSAQASDDCPCLRPHDGSGQLSAGDGPPALHLPRAFAAFKPLHHIPSIPEDESSIQEAFLAPPTKPPIA